MEITSILPILKTDRLIVRLAERKDRDTVLAYYRENRQHLQPFNPTWPSDFLTKPFWDRQVDLNVDEFYADMSARMFVFLKTEPHIAIGNVGLSGIMRNAAQFCFLGYGISRDMQMRGLMSEAVSAVVQYGFTDLNLHRIMANYVPTNERSGKLLRRLGFTVEGYARDYLYIDGEWKDHVMTSITNQNWKPE